MSRSWRHINLPCAGTILLYIYVVFSFIKVMKSDGCHGFTLMLRTQKELRGPPFPEISKEECRPHVDSNTNLIKVRSYFGGAFSFLLIFVTFFPLRQALLLPSPPSSSSGAMPSRGDKGGGASSLSSLSLSYHSRGPMGGGSSSSSASMSSTRTLSPSDISAREGPAAPDISRPTATAVPSNKLSYSHCAWADNPPVLLDASNWRCSFKLRPSTSPGRRS